jgi:hypothetical protein
MQVDTLADVKGLVVGIKKPVHPRAGREGVYDLIAEGK